MKIKKKLLVIKKELNLLNILRRFEEILAENKPFLGDLKSFEQENRN